jgi:hypothetical protein
MVQSYTFGGICKVEDIRKKQTEFLAYSITFLSVSSDYARETFKKLP